VFEWLLFVRRRLDRWGAMIHLPHEKPRGERASMMHTPLYTVQKP
jgi:hypothetical protein